MPRSSELVLSTDMEVRNARASGPRTEFRIKGASNLVLRVAKGGSKSWAFLYASPTSGRRAKLTLGAYPAIGLKAARDEAQSLSVLVKSGVDPLAARRAAEAGLTFSAIADRYLVELRQKRSRVGASGAYAAEVERLLSANVLPKIGHHRADAITRPQIASVVEAVANRGALVSADHVLGAVRAIYNWGNGAGLIENDPTRGLKKRNASKPRQRTLSDTELRALWEALDHAPKLSFAVRVALRLQLLLGVRIGEVLGAEQSEFDFAQRLWTIPAHRTKANRVHPLPLPPMALGLVAGAQREALGQRWLFPSAHDDRPFRAKSAMRAVLRMRDELGLTDIGTHDLRRTLATGLGDLGISDEIIERILNHAPRTVAGRHYNHAKYQGPMRSALEQWEAKVASILEAPQHG